MSADDPDIYVEVQPNADGSFDIVIYCRASPLPGHDLRFAEHWPESRHTWSPTRRELKRLKREGRDPYDEALRRGRHALEAHRAAAEQDAALRAQIRRLT